MSLRYLLFLILGLHAAAFAAPDTADSATAERVHTLLTGLTSLQAEFHQELFDEYGELIEASDGTVVIAKPGRFRWEYKTPYEQLIVADGETLWVYDADLEQASQSTIDPADPASPAALLADDVDLTAHYHVTVAEHDGGEWVTLQPKTQSSQYAQIKLQLSNNVITGMELRDNLSQLTKISFQTVVVDEPIDSSPFQFVPPPGTDVVHSGRR